MPGVNSFYVVNRNGTNEATANVGARYRNHVYENYIALPEDASQDDREVELRCPICTDFFLEPLITPGGLTYEANAIWRWLEQHDTDPISREPLSIDDLRPNRAITEVVTTYIAAIPAGSRPSDELVRGRDHDEAGLQAQEEDFTQRLDQASSSFSGGQISAGDVARYAMLVGMVVRLALNHPDMVSASVESAGAITESVDLSQGYSSFGF